MLTAATCPSAPAASRPGLVEMSLQKLALIQCSDLAVT